MAYQQYKTRVVALPSDSSDEIAQQLRQLQNRLVQCHLCPDMQGPPVHGEPVAASILLVGQAPGEHEIAEHRPFAWTAGKTLFRWFDSIGANEQVFRQKVYMSAVCRCFPGKKPSGGDRVPNADEIGHCARWLEGELAIVQPALIIPVGKLAIGRFLHFRTLREVIGQRHEVSIDGRTTDVIPLPHPSGASTWHVTEPGKTLLQKALRHIRAHSAFTATFLT